MKIHMKSQIYALYATSALGVFSLLLITGCTTKNYVRSQTQPIIQRTNELDDATATNNRNIHDVDQRAQAGIQQAQKSADTANQQAQTASQSATQAHDSAQDAITRADSLGSVVANLDNFKQVADTTVNFGFDKADLTRTDRAHLDEFAGHLDGTTNYILEITGGTDNVGSREYNYDLSQRRAQAVVQYLVVQHNVAARRFYLIGIGMDREVASNSTPAGRAKNRRVEIQMLSNMKGQNATAPAQTSKLATPQQ